MKINVELLKKLEETIDTLHPERGEVPIKILGYGEISLVFELLEDKSVAYKRLPIFDSETQVKRHVLAYNKYHEILDKKIGLNIPLYDTTWVETSEGNISLYCAQEKISPASVGNKIIHQITKDEVQTLILLLLREMKKVWEFSRKNETFDVGLDGQISNWSLIGYDPDNPQVTKNTQLLYLDTSTPMFRVNGVEAMEAALILKSAPSFLRPFLEAIFLQEILDRYYDWRLVAIDLIGNLYKEQRSDLIPESIRTVNDFFSNEAGEFQIEPLSLEEVHSYYQSDKRIWTIFQTARKMDRYFKTKMLRGKYAFYIPEDIQR